MPKQTSPTSVNTIVSNLQVDHSHTFEGKNYNSVAVMVSQLRKNEQHINKRFKIKSENGNTTVTRVN